MNDNEQEMYKSEEFESLSFEGQREELDRVFHLQWDINMCCPYFTVEKCTDEQSHIACKICLDEDGDLGIDNAYAALACMSDFFYKCSKRLRYIQSKS